MTMLEVLLEATLRATLIAGAVVVVLWLLRARAAAVRHRVWTVAMLAMLASPVWTAWVPEIALRVLPPTPASSAGGVAPSALEAPGSATLTRMEPAAAGSVEPGPAAAGGTAWSWTPWLLAIYLTGAGVLLARLAAGIFRVSSLTRDANIVNGRRTCARIATPFTVGLFEPKILLPEGWDRWPAARLAAVLDHERVHVARRDPLVQCLALLNRAVFWFHPLAWWLERHLAALAEEACDAAVLARGHGPADYAEHLLDLARLSSRRAIPHGVGMPMPGSKLPTRIAKILEDRVGRPGSRTAVAGAAALATLISVALGTITLAQEPAPGQETLAPRGLVETYELTLENDVVVREAEAKYRALAEAAPETPSDQQSATVAQAMTDYEAARQDLLIRLAEAYFKVLSAEDTVAALDAERAAASKGLEQAERRFEVGLIAVTPVQEARARLEQALANADAAERALAATRGAMNEIVGADVGELSRVSDNLPLSAPDPADADQWVKTAMLQNLAMMSARTAAEIAAGDGTSRQSMLDYIERVARQTEQDTRGAYLGVISEMARLQALREAVRASEAALEATSRGFEVGTRTSLEVALEQHNLRGAATAYAASRYNYLLNLLRLRHAAGDLTVESLQDVESRLE